MSNESPYDIKKDYDLEKARAVVEIGEVLEFRAGRHIAIQRVTTTAPIHIESLIYTLDDFAVDSNGNVISELHPAGALPKHATGAQELGGMHVYTYPNTYVAKNASDIVHWVLAVPRRKQGGPVNDNAGPFKFIALYIPRQEESKFQILSHKKELDINRETMDYVKSLNKYEQNLVCGKWWKFFGCRMLR